MGAGGTTALRYLSVCSGIEAATVAWHQLGWEPAAFSEIEPFPRAVLQHHYPDVPLHGDFTTIEGNEYGPIDLLVGGTPCQSFSVAGLRGGMDDERGQLALQFLRLLDRTRARWVVWENVPGVLSSNGGQDFGSFLGGLVELGYGFAYRVLDAQHFGVPQRRRRVFVVGHIGDWRRAAAVLFERHSLSGDSPPRREKGQESAVRLGFSTVGSLSGGYGSKLGTDESCQGSVIPDWPADVCPTLDTYYGDKMGLEDQHVFNQRGGKFVQGWWPPEVADPISASEGKTYTHEGTNFRTHNVVPSVYSLQGGGRTSQNSQGSGFKEDVSFTLNCMDEHAVAVFDPCQITSKGNRSQPTPGVCHTLPAQSASEQANSYAWERDVYPTLNAQIPNDTSNIQQGVRLGSAVRRLTPRECERLQGFPDDYTLIPYRGKPAADGPRYRALGNSMAVPVMSWLGQRIAAVEAIQTQAEAA